jgi:hypothetical protein
MTKRAVPVIHRRLERIRRRLNAWVIADGRSHNAIAAEGDLHQPTLSRILAGARSDPALSTLLSILGALKKTLADLDAD